MIDVSSGKLGWIDDDFDAPVELPSGRRRIGGDRERRAVAAGVDAVRVDALAHQGLLDRSGAALGQQAVALAGAGAVGEALDGDVALRVAPQELREIIERAVRPRL